MHMRYLADSQCAYVNCETSVYSLGLCRSHYLQQRRGQPLRPAGTRATEFRSPCAIVFCTRLSMSNGTLCKSHSNVARVHHITHAALMALTDHGCDACGSPGRVEVDHDHSCCDQAYSACGKCVRGALCRVCNTVLAYVEQGRQTPAVIRMLESLSTYLGTYSRERI